MEDFERVVETCMPLVVISSLHGVLPDLIKAFGRDEKGQPTQTPLPEPTGNVADAPAENGHDT